jgi:hypothetical protein
MTVFNYAITTTPVAADRVPVVAHLGARKLAVAACRAAGVRRRRTAVDARVSALHRAYGRAPVAVRRVAVVAIFISDKFSVAAHLIARGHAAYG